MAEILKVLTPEQIVELAQNYIISKNVGITNFNDAGRVQTILEAVALIESTTGFDYLDGLRKAIPISLYDGIKFTRKGALTANGYIKYFRLPLFTLNYVGSSTSVTISCTPTTLSTTVTGFPAQNLSIDLTIYTTIQDVITQINLNSNYVAVLLSGNGALPSNTIYNYVNLQIVGEFNYLNNAGIGIMRNIDTLISIIANQKIQIDNQNYSTVNSAQIDAGRDISLPILVNADIAGTDGNKSVNALDTLNGKGLIITAITGVEHARNDIAITGGQVEESNEDRANRFQITVQGLNGSTNLSLIANILSVPQIRSAVILEQYPQPGINTVVADRGDGTLTLEDINAIKKVLEGDPADIANYPGHRPAGIIFNYLPPLIQPVNITVNITRIGTLSDTTEIQNVVVSLLSSYINTRKLGEDVILNGLRAIVQKAHPAIYDSSISLPSANVSIPGTTVARTGIVGGVITITFTTIPALP